MIIFYVLCLLYVLSTATVVCDLVNIILGLYLDVSNNPICNLNIYFYQFYRNISHSLDWQLTP